MLCKQASTQRFCHHQACFTRALERGTTHRNELPVPDTPKTYQIVKSINKMKILHQLMGKTASQHQKGSIKFTHSNINPKYKCAKCTNQNTQTGKLDKKPKPISVLYPGNPSHMQGYTKAQNKGMEEDLPSKWRAKKSRIAILISDKIDFKATKTKRDKEGHYKMVKGSTQQEELTILNIYHPIQEHQDT